METKIISEFKKSELIEKVINNLGISFTVISASLYGIGYLVVTSYLASKGISDQIFLTSKYVLTGLLTTIIICFFYFFIWRKLPELVEKNPLFVKTKNKFALLIYSTYFLIELTYRILFTTIIILSTTGKSELTPFLIFFGIPFFIDFLFQKISIYEKSPNVASFISSVLYATWICIAFIYIRENKIVLNLFTQLAGLTIISIFIFYSDSWIKNRDRIYVIFYYIFYVAGVAISFGSTIYEEISPKFGGGNPIQVEITLHKDADDALIKAIAVNPNDTFLITQTDHQTILKTKDTKNNYQYIQIKNSLINSITTSPHNNSLEKPYQEIKKIRNIICDLSIACPTIK